ncbi:MAG: CBS domain-containing protein [Desulfurococcales archaeon]|nr:CBS domain-containing protein [Desulfurococcales archaeon]MCE4629056.1 CBS domain-containing protein [Desulfurococcales archaeon]
MTGIEECKGLDKKAYQVMSTPVVVASVEEFLEDAARRMYESNVGSVVIVDRNNKLAGILSRRDVLYLVATGEARKNPKVSTVMTASVITGTSDEALASLLQKMRSAGVKHIVIVDGEDKPIGIVSMWDILMSIAKECLGEDD